MPIQGNCQTYISFAVSTDTFLGYASTTLRILLQRTQCAFCTSKQFKDLISYSYSTINLDSTHVSVCATKKNNNQTNIKITTTGESLESTFVTAKKRQ